MHIFNGVVFDFIRKEKRRVNRRKSIDMLDIYEIPETLHVCASDLIFFSRIRDSTARK